MNRPDIYAYTAAANPHFARALIHKYGYVPEKGITMASALRQLVAAEGEPALHDILENNPDKEVMFEYFESKKPKELNACGCGKTAEAAAFMNFTGQVQQVQQQQENRRLVMETSVLGFAGAVLIAFAIMSTQINK